MKLLILSQYFWPETFRVNDLAVRLQEKGHKVTVLTALPNYPKGTFFEGYGWKGPFKETYKGVEVIRVPLFPRGKGGGFRLALNYLSFVFFGTIRILTLGRRRFDATFVFGVSPITMAIPGIALRAVFGTPLTLWVQDLWPEAIAAVGAVRSPLLLSAINHLVSWIYKRCDFILAQSKAFVSKLRERGVTDARLDYFPNWAEEIFEGQVTEADNTIALPKGFNIIFAGNIGAAQNLELLIQAAEYLKQQKDIHWIFVGEGSKKAFLESEIKNRNLQSTVHLLGHYPLERMPGLFSSADLLLVSLRSDPLLSLTIPSKIQAYMASGRPILGFLEGEGARLIQESKSGWICPPESPLNLCKLLTEITLLTKEERDSYGRRGQEYYRRFFTRERSIVRLEQLLKSLTLQT